MSSIRDGGIDTSTRTVKTHKARTEKKPEARAPDDPSPFAKVLAGLGREIDKGEGLVDKAVHGGKELSNLDLLTLQAGVYRYSEAVDLTAKLVDRASSGLKTVIQGQ